MSRDSQVDGNTQKYCLSIWAIDQAGNASNHNVEFIWKVVVPPVSLDVNSGNYWAYRKADDVMSMNRRLWELFKAGSPISLKKNIVLGHTIMANPYPEPLSAKLELKKPLELAMSCGKYQIPEKSIEIRPGSRSCPKTRL